MIVSLTIDIDTRYSAYDTGEDDTTYGAWGKCSKTCNNGTQQRTIYCSNTPCGYLTGYCNVKPCIS